MVKKIKKKIKKGPKGNYAVPLCLALTCLYGIRLEGKDFRGCFDAPEKIREVLNSHLGRPVLMADRVLSQAEFCEWGLRSVPGRLAEMFSRSGLIPMGPPTGVEEEGPPMLGILPFLALVKGKELEGFVHRAVAEFSEVNRVAFQNSAASGFNLIPGYDHLLYSPPCHAKQLNQAVSVLSRMMEEAFYNAGLTPPERFELFEEELIAGIPVSEPFSR